jgi:hypothetical protein
VYRELKMFAFFEMLIFVVLILSGFLLHLEERVRWTGPTPNRDVPYGESRESKVLGDQEMLPDALKDHARSRRRWTRAAGAIHGRPRRTQRADAVYRCPRRIVEVCRYLKDQQGFIR